MVNGQTSERSPVRIGVPQWSVLGPVLFVIFINDLDEGVRNHTLKFADDTKLFSQVSTYEDAEKLQKDLSTLNEWSNEWSMLFNAEKCKCIHYGYNNKQQRWSNRTRVLVLEYEYFLSTRTRVRRKVIVLVLEYITKVIVLTITSHDYIFFM